MDVDGEISLENQFTFLLIFYSYIKFFHAYMHHKKCILKLLCSTSSDFSQFISIVNYKFKSPLKCVTVQKNPTFSLNRWPYTKLTIVHHSVKGRIEGRLFLIGTKTLNF